MKKLVKMVKLNNLQYNPNRDPGVYRRCPNETFRIQALLEGAGQARCKIIDQAGKTVAERIVVLPGIFNHELSFPTPGVRVLTLEVESNAEKFRQDLRLDVLDHSWVG